MRCAVCMCSKLFQQNRKKSLFAKNLDSRNLALNGIDSQNFFWELFIVSLSEQCSEISINPSCPPHSTTYWYITYTCIEDLDFSVGVALLQKH